MGEMGEMMMMMMMFDQLTISAMKDKQTIQ